MPDTDGKWQKGDTVIKEKSFSTHMQCLYFVLIMSYFKNKQTHTHTHTNTHMSNLRHTHARSRWLFETDRQTDRQRESERERGMIITTWVTKSGVSRDGWTQVGKRTGYNYFYPELRWHIKPLPSNPTHKDTHIDTHTHTLVHVLPLTQRHPLAHTVWYIHTPTHLENTHK